MLRGMLMVAVLAATVLLPMLSLPCSGASRERGVVDKRGDAERYRGGLSLEKSPRVALLDHEG